MKKMQKTFARPTEKKMYVVLELYKFIYHT